MARANPVIRSIAKAVLVYSESVKNPLTGDKGVELPDAYAAIATALQTPKVREAVMQSAIAQQTHVPKPRAKKA